MNLFADEASSGESSGESGELSEASGASRDGRCIYSYIYLCGLRCMWDRIQCHLSFRNV